MDFNTTGFGSFPSNKTSTSDIEWSKPVSEIDAQLYQKYNLSADETAFIEKMIRAME